MGFENRVCRGQPDIQRHNLATRLATDQRTLVTLMERVALKGQRDKLDLAHLMIRKTNTSNKINN